MRNRKNIAVKILAVLAFLVFLIINSRSISNPFRTGISGAASLPLKGLNGAMRAVKKIIPFASLREENRLLRERIDLLNRRIEESGTLSAENRRLKDILGFKNAIPFSSIPAEVIGRDPSNWSNSLIINKGSAHGINDNRAVISMKGLVGRTLEVGRTSSKILLITDPNSKAGVIIQRNRQGGILVGRPDGSCKMIYIALDSDVAPGDRVITAGFGSVFPKGILIGEVAAVGKEPGRLYKYAIVRPAQDMTKLEEVLCIR
ncbi:MAG: rod shape-determining protein MreC [Candidatus Omnitrophica bacterium]|nr:rod shape-determining protein MreC [Candidatus Omnitrophota bacterium]